MNYPIRFNPIFKERIWGSDRLSSVFGKDLPAGKLIGESWEFVDLADDSNIAANGPLAGQSIGEIIPKHGESIGFTKEQCRHPFGLLIKFLDAADVLSVQVHPDRQACLTLPHARMKTECWVVVHAEADSVIYRGLKDGVGQADLEEALKAGSVDQLLRVYSAKKGDFHFLPAGTVHAIGAGLIIAEIQTPSDTTYRLFDWNRRDAAGNSRQLHIQEALVSTHFTDTPPPTAAGSCPP
ncbi:MAG: class I mannose-6-phosphate isomerase [Planctomycetes bacterium]|nr:class I mannose-6-phosphate isomerase [Planctomycetota bacterium]